VWLCGITVNISQTGFEFAFFGFISMSLTYQLPSSIEFYLKADFSFTVAKLIISPSLLLLVRIVSSTFLFTEIVVLSRARSPVSHR
jgi:hypothetical protein